MAWNRVVQMTAGDQVMRSSSNTNGTRQYIHNPERFHSEQLYYNNRRPDNQQVLFRERETWPDAHSDNAELEHRGILPTPPVHENIVRTIVRENDVNHRASLDKVVVKKMFNDKNIKRMHETSLKTSSCSTDLTDPEIKKKRAARFSKDISVPVAGKIVSLTVKNKNHLSKQLSVTASSNKLPKKKVVLLIKKPDTSCSKPLRNIQSPTPDRKKGKADVSVRSTTTYNQVRSKMNGSNHAVSTPDTAHSVPAPKPITSSTIISTAKASNNSPKTKLKVKRLQKLPSAPIDVQKVATSANTSKSKSSPLKRDSTSKVVQQKLISIATSKHNKLTMLNSSPKVVHPLKGLKVVSLKRDTDPEDAINKKKRLEKFGSPKTDKIKPSSPKVRYPQKVVSLKRDTDPEDATNKKRRLEKFGAPKTDKIKHSFSPEESMDLSQNQKPFKKSVEELVTIKSEDDEILWDEPMIELDVKPEHRCLNVNKDHGHSHVTSSSRTQHDTSTQSGNVQQLKKSIMRKINSEVGNKSSNNPNRFEGLIDRIVDKILDDPEIKQSLEHKDTPKSSSSRGRDPSFSNESEHSRSGSRIKKNSYPNTQQGFESSKQKDLSKKQKKKARKRVIMEQSPAPTDKILTTYCDENRGRQYAEVQEHDNRHHAIQSMPDSRKQPHQGQFLAEFAEKSKPLPVAQPQQGTHRRTAMNLMNMTTPVNLNDKRQTQILSNNQVYKYNSSVGTMDSEAPLNQYYTKATEKRHTLLPSPAQSTQIQYYNDQSGSYQQPIQHTSRPRSPVIDNHPTHSSNSQLLLQQFTSQSPNYYTNNPSAHHGSIPTTVRAKSPVLANPPAHNTNALNLLLQQFGAHPAQPPMYYANQLSTQPGSISNAISNALFTGNTSKEQKSHHKIETQNPRSSRFDTHTAHQQYSSQINTRNATHSDQIKPTRQAQSSNRPVSTNLHCRSCRTKFTSESLLQDHLQSDLHLMVTGEWWERHRPPPASVTLRDVIWCILCQKDFRFTSTKLLREHLICERHCDAKSSWVHQFGKPPMYDWCLFSSLKTNY